MSILLTGANGFIGSRLLQRLSTEFGRDKIVLLTSKPIEGYKCICYQNADLSTENIQEIKTARFDCVFHVGAFTPKSGAESNLALPNANNIVFTAKLLGSVITKKLVFISTLDVYAPASGTICETTVTMPSTMYGKSKLFCEDIVIQWGSQTNTIIQVLRLGHVYGIGEEVYRKFLPQLIINLVKNTPIEVWGDGTDFRAFIHIHDVINAISKAAELNEFAGPINLCSSKSFHLVEYIEMAEHIMGKKACIIHKDRVGNKIDFVFDVSKMNTLLITESVDIIEGLTEEISYLKNKYN